MSPLQVKPVPSISMLRAYQSSPAPEGITLPLSGTERPIIDGMQLQTLQKWADALPLHALSRYPDAKAIEARLATRWGVDANRIMLTAGADEAIDRAFRAVACAEREVIITTPTFEMISHYAELAGATIKRVPWEWGAFPVDAVLQQITARTVATVVVTPNNPTGLVVSERALRQIAEHAPHALLMVDMAYGEFADLDPMPAMRDVPNALFFRTFSKAWGLPGLRIGYAVGHADVLQWMRTAGGPYSVAHPSLVLLEKFLEDDSEDVAHYVNTVRDERTQWVDMLHGLGIAAMPSQANFVLARHPRKAWIVSGLAALGISVRTFAKEPSLHDAMRITCPGNAMAFQRLQHAMRSVMQPEALLFDLDGVLADVSGSYRASIIATAQEYGVDITHDDIAQAKSAGSANNDWELTQRLLAQHGVQATLNEVTERFERIYQGTAEGVGLRATEKLLCTRTWMQDLARRMPIAIVTGRPRADAERFLSEQGILACMTTLVCMEDAPLKPDPAPVRKAMQILGVQSAWMIGDTPDDLRSASAAGVLPIGVVAPGDRKDHVMRTALLRAGAAHVLDDLMALEVLLP